MAHDESRDAADVAAHDAVVDATQGDGGGRSEVGTAWRRPVVLFLTGQTVSLFGSMLVQYAIMWHLTLETRSGAVMAVYAVVGFLPQAVVSVFGGVWADRLPRKWLIAGADAAIAGSTLVLVVLMLNGVDDLWVVYTAAAIRSAGAGIQTPAVASLLPQITPAEHLMRVNGINGTIQSAMMLVAPAAAAALYASASLPAVFAVDVVTAVIGIGLLLMVPVGRVERDDQAAGVRGYLADLVGGIRYVHQHAFVRWVLALWAVVFVLIVAPSFLTPLLIVRSFGDAVWMLTANELAFSIGMVLGGVAVSWWGGLRNRVLMVVAATALFGLLNVGLGLAPSLWLFLAFMFLLGLGVPFFSTPTTTLLQETVEPDRQGRVFGFMGVVMALAMPVGMSVLGPLADRLSIESILVATGVLLFAVVGGAVALPVGRRMVMRAEHPAEPAAATEPADAPEPA